MLPQRTFPLFAGLLGLASAQVLYDFQVAEPAPVPTGDAQTCTVKILERTFGDSYGDPEIVQYTPPTDCGDAGSWAGITLNLTVTSNGTQYDRLGIFTFQNTEIWRTSTPEPTPDGIFWTYTKDVTRYTPLFKEPGTFILELDNELSTGLTGQYATTVYATFYAATAQYTTAPQSNLIVPISTLSNTSADDASVPPVFSTNITLPKNTVEIYAELYASGNGNEEFWYTNTANAYLGDLPADTTYGDGPFREVRLLVDGQVAGVAFPYAVIFTGGINPSCWQPITSYGAIDLPTYFLDLTPFVPVFADGLPHNVSLDVASAESNHTINANWYVSGLLQVVTDPSGQPTTGNITAYDVQPYAVAHTDGSVGANGDVTVTVAATRSVRIESTIVSGSGDTTAVVWAQDLEFSNTQYYLDNATTQNIVQTGQGTVLSTHNGKTVVSDKFEYPLAINVTYFNITNTSESFYSAFDHSYNRQVSPAPFILGSTINNHQTATGYFTIAANGNSGNGTNNNTFSYADTAGNTYDRTVDAAYLNITYDQQGGSLAPGAVALLDSVGGIAPVVQNVPMPRLPLVKAKAAGLGL
ncbi:hypothetical protein CONPUDRAFT_87677 [Coniophora puteana RWD-64-598 SS2]|uniref:Peptide N-acetyl-beta-D-glucosaminyl asparaginase amidase A N-terminal domain-containing protein n=1 Tax=Coniophora puteana (strain RWD-64-598) TaxID=741705 RepID=A0A5M3N1K0_CONPW|nr:uncharacterized protein CONPUDRAFT_87677 [Coniophora puteana RWD-64-598 SS2]EIW85186.1 hypothetical protein CONPUDRAFT_87677 [Coniophora puteana RWD-64-598 SS2]